MSFFTHELPRYQRRGLAADDGKTSYHSGEALRTRIAATSDQRHLNLCKHALHVVVALNRAARAFYLLTDPSGIVYNDPVAFDTAWFTYLSTRTWYLAEVDCFKRVERFYRWAGWVQKRDIEGDRCAEKGSA